MPSQPSEERRGPDGRPNCGYCAERLAVNVGLLAENTELKRKLVTGEASSEILDALRDVYGYMCEVEGSLAGHIAVRSYLSLPRTPDERKALGERARRLLGIAEPTS